MSDNLVGLEKTTPYLAWGGKIKPKEIDQYVQYHVCHPGISASAVVAACAGTGVTGTVATAYLDYPRTLSFKYVDASGTTAISTATVTGHDQFNQLVTEEMVFTQLGTGTTQGTQVFAHVGTVTFAGANRASGDDQAIGYGNAGGTAMLGLPCKVDSAADVISVNWIDNSTAAKPGTCTIDTNQHAAKMAVGTLSDQDDYIFLIRPTFDTNDDESCKGDNINADYIS